MVNIVQYLYMHEQFGGMLHINWLGHHKLSTYVYLCVVSAAHVCCVYEIID